jgi:hypothetical protein
MPAIKQMSASQWWNYRTVKYDNLTSFPSDETVTDYMPQEAAALNMYKLLRDAYQMSPQEAMIYVLESSLNIPHTVELPHVD